MGMGPGPGHMGMGPGGPMGPGKHLLKQNKNSVTKLKLYFMKIQ